jgi:hypothetical protein
MDISNWDMHTKREARKESRWYRIQDSWAIAKTSSRSRFDQKQDSLIVSNEYGYYLFFTSTYLPMISR